MKALLNAVLRALKAVLSILSPRRQDAAKSLKCPKTSPKLSPDAIIEANPRLFVGKREDWIKVEWVIEHHSLTRDQGVKDWVSICRYHMSYRIDHEIVSQEEFERRLKAKDGKSFQKPWRAVGYGCGAERVNGELKVFPGRSLAISGAHAKQFNHRSAGCLLVGNFDLAPPDEEQYEICAITAAKYLRVFELPTPRLIGHVDANRMAGLHFKSCPGSKFDLDKLRSIVDKLDEKSLLKCPV